jgi:Flp pilus assembly protein TadG
MLVLLGLIGGGVDMARAYKTDRRLQAACDAGVLAGRRAVTTNGFDASAQAQAHQYFDANYDQASQQTEKPVFTPISNDNGNTVEGSATVTLSTVIMTVFGFDNLDLDVSCAASMGVGNSDIVFVLDNTGSMARAPNGSSWSVPPTGTRIYALQQAMKGFRDTVDASVAGSNARIRYGFVPYSSAVNVGRLLYDHNPSFLSNTITVQSVKFVNWNTSPIRTWTSGTPTETSASGVTSWSNTSGRYDSDRACQNGLPGDSAWTNYGGQATDSTSLAVETDTGNQIKTTGVHQAQRRTEYRCNNRYRQSRTAERELRSSIYEERTPVEVTTSGSTFADAILQQRTIDVSTYKTFVATPNPTGINGSGVLKTNFTSTTWDGCIMERDTTAASSFSFVSLLTGITPSAAFDLNIDLAPSNAATQWRPLWPEVTFERERAYAYEGIASTSGSFDRRTLSGRKATTLCPAASRLLAEMEEDDFDEYADSLVATGSTYHDIGLLWGARLSSPTGIFANNVSAEPGNGGTVSRHLIFMTDGPPEPSWDVNSSYGIELLDKRITGNGTSNQLARHTSRFLAVCEAIKGRGIRLWVIAFGTGLTNDLITCGSPNSSFKSDDAEELDESFQEIAKQVGELRVIQ